MVDSQADRIARLECSVLLMAEVVRDVVDAVAKHDHYGSGIQPDLVTKSKLDRALGRLDAIVSPLGLGSVRDAVGRDGGGVGGVDG